MRVSARRSPPPYTRASSGLRRKARPRRRRSAAAARECHASPPTPTQQLLRRRRRHINAACDGLCASNELRQSAEVPLHCIRELLSPPYATGSHDVFAAACGGAAAAVDGIEFAALVQMWDVLKIDKELQGRRAPGYNCDFILALARSRCDAQTAARLDSRLAQLRAPGPPRSGKSLVGVPRRPPHLRGATLSQLHVLCRLRAAAGAPVPSSLQGTPELLAFLDDGCGGLLEQPPSGTRATLSRRRTRRSAASRAAVTCNK